MNFAFKRKVSKAAQTGSLVEFYPHDLQYYRIPPINNLSLQEFEELAIERLKVLRILAAVTTLKGFRAHSEEWKAAVLEEMTKEGLKNFARSCRAAGFGTTDAELQARRRDHISHFILRLAYCRSEELRRWFTAREQELFKMRFQSMTADGITKFLKCNGLEYVPISQEEKSNVLENLYESTTGCAHIQIETMSFYKVQFNEVFDLVRLRKVFLHQGYAYIPSSDFVSVILSRYRSHLNHALAVASRKLPDVEHDERIVSLLKGLHNSYTGVDYNNAAKSQLPIESLDALSAKSYPLCMRQLHEQLRSSHHMKHGGRLQYGLFLKAAGVTLEDSLRFWREEFTKIMDLDKFEKQYAYNVRYNYGKEGSRKNYSAFSCIRIIQGSVGPGDSHGCPFRHCEPATLSNKLLAYGINPLGVSAIVDLSKKGHYQIACSKYFDMTHNVQVELGVNHPNQYLEESISLAAGNFKPNADRVKVEKSQTTNGNGTKEAPAQWDDGFDDFTESDMSKFQDIESLS